MRLLALILLALAVSVPAARAAVPDTTHDDLTARVRRLAPLAADEVLWLARCLYTESDRAREQRLVGWVVRNRVETAYRGRTYREVVLEAQQFSAFNAPSPRRDSVLTYGPASTRPQWRQALGVALAVYEAHPADRPFPMTVRHFYSPIGMPGGVPPTWAVGRTPLDHAQLGVDPARFLFFDDVDADGGSASVEATWQPASPSVRGAAARPAPRRSLRRQGTTPSVTRPARPAIQRPSEGRSGGNTGGTGG